MALSAFHIFKCCLGLCFELIANCNTLASYLRRLHEQTPLFSSSNVQLWLYSSTGHSDKCVSLLQENFINLPGLLFSCKYRITVHSLSAKRRSKDESIFFLTPSCATLQSKSVKPIACPGDTRKHGDAYHSLGVFVFRINVIQFIHSAWNMTFEGLKCVKNSGLFLLYYSLLWLHITFTLY